MSKIIYVSIAILIYMIINLFITIKKNTKILHFAGSVLFLQFFLLSAVNSHFITLSEYSVCEYIFLFPNSNAEKSTGRRQLDALLDGMSDKGIRIVTATAREITEVEKAED